MTSYVVCITEYERGWGQRPDGREYFQGKGALEKAQAFVKEHNSRNNLPYVPDCYWIAEEPRLCTDEEATAALKSRKKAAKKKATK